MIVKIVYEFDADVEDFDPEFIDIQGLAKDSAKRDMQYLLEKNMLSADDFEYLVEGNNENLGLRGE